MRRGGLGTGRAGEPLASGPTLGTPLSFPFLMKSASLRAAASVRCDL